MKYVLASSHNFIDTRIAKQLNIFIYPTSEFQVSIPGNKTTSCDGKCHKIELSMSEYKLKSLMYAMPIGGVDIVLGAQWLATLGTVGLNLQEKFIRFYENGKKYKLQGINCPPPQIVSSNRMEKMIKKGAQAYFLHCYSMDGTADDNNNGYPKELEELQRKYSTIFQEPPRGLPPPCSRDHITELILGAAPIRRKSYRQSHQHKTEIERLVQELLDCGVITRSKSPFSAPVILVRKKDGSYRLCIDYQALNKITIKDKFPIPFVDELLDELHGAKYFSKLDLKSGYYQIRIREEDIPKTAFCTHEGLYEFWVMPFGLSNAPATFQAIMNDLFRPHLRKFVLIFFDDTLVYSKNWKLHLKHVEIVLKLLQENKFYANKSKCSFG